MYRYMPQIPTHVSEHYWLLPLTFGIDIDECTETLVPSCDPNALCENRIGSFECTCHPGYSGNGTICGKIQLHLSA